MSRKLTNEEFIEKSKKVHGDKYDYSLVEYVNYSTKVKIIYNENIYEQLPSNHLKGFVCENIKKMTKEEFIQKSKEIHGDKYDYSLVDFKNVRGKVKLIYNDIVYEQYTYANLQGKSPELVPIKITKKEFIRRARIVHGDTFDYSLVKIEGISNKVDIIYENKKYSQKMFDHLRGHYPRGIIKDSKGVSDIIDYLENNNIKYIREYYYEDCKNISYLRFDFYLEDYNILIEYDGEQHFRSVVFFGGDDGFKKLQHNDNIKNKYCEQNRIPLLRISYLENINEKLSNYLESYLKL